MDIVPPDLFRASVSLFRTYFGPHLIPFYFVFFRAGSVRGLEHYSGYPGMLGSRTRIPKTLSTVVSESNTFWGPSGPFCHETQFDEVGRKARHLVGRLSATHMLVLTHLQIDDFRPDRIRPISSTGPQGVIPWSPVTPWDGVYSPVLCSQELGSAQMLF